MCGEHDSSSSVGEQRHETEGIELHWNGVQTQSSGTGLVPRHRRRQLPHQVRVMSESYGVLWACTKTTRHNTIFVC